MTASTNILNISLPPRLSFSDYLSGFGDFFSGLTGSFLSSLASQPLQTIKIRQQLSDHPTNALTLVKTMLKTEGPISLLKGLHSQLVSGCLSTAISSLLIKILRLYQTQKDCEDDEQPITYLVKTELLGSVMQALLKCPAELVTVRMRVKAGFNEEIEDFSSCLVCATKIWSQFGIKAFWKGTLITLLKQGVPAAVGITTFETACRKIAHGKPRANLPLWNFSLCGAIAGATVAIINQPVDIIKTHFQVDPISGPKFQHYKDCVQKIYQVNGVRGFFSGLGVAMVNETIANSTMSVTVALVSKMLKKLEKENQEEKVL